MKRPLCLLAILVTAVVWLYLEIIPINYVSNGMAKMQGDHVSVTGRVSAKEVKKDYLGETIPVIYLTPVGEDAPKDATSSMQVQCYLENRDNVPAIGEYVLLRGKVKIFEPPTNPGEFDSCLYYSTMKISYRLTGAEVLRKGGRANAYRELLFRIKMYLESSLDNVLDDKDSAVMKAMLLGDKAFLDQETKDMYRMSGIMHILAVSGLHVSVIGMGLYKLLMWLSMQVLTLIPVNVSGRKRYLGGRDVSLLMFRLLPALLSILFMHSYGVMCGMSTSSFRAICMFAMRLLAPLLGRTYDVLSALALSEILLLIDQPLYLYNSGFLFSFGAVLGIAVIRPKLSELLRPEDNNSMKFIREKGQGPGKAAEAALDAAKVTFDSLITGVSIAISTLPVYAMFYYTYPVHSLLLNLLVIPMMTVLMFAGIICMLLGTVSAMAGMMPGYFVHLILYMYKLISSSSKAAGMFTWYMGHSDKWQVGLYVAMVTVFVMFPRVADHLLKSCGAEHLSESSTARSSDKRKLPQNRDRSSDKAQNFVTYLYCSLCMNKTALRFFRGALLILAMFALTFHMSPDLEINMIDVGQGDGIVVSSGGRHMLIDGGSTSKKNVGRYQIIPFLKYKGIGRLDTVVVTHEDEDHISGILEIFDDMEKGGIKVRKLMMPEIAESSMGENYRLLVSRAKELDVPVLFINSGESFDLGKAHFTCLNPSAGMMTEGANEYSTVLFMEYDNKGKVIDQGTSDRGCFTALFTGDVEGQGQDYLKEQLSRMKASASSISLLKVAHHGSKYTTDEEFLELIRPDMAVISCGRDNVYGHPHEDVLDRLDHVSATVLRTDIGGCTSVAFDNGSLSVMQFK